MFIHIRTTIRRQFSFVDVVAVQIGNDVLEMKGGDAEIYWINGVEHDATSVSSISGFPMDYRRVNSKQRLLVIHLPDDQSIEIRTYKEFVSVNVHGATSADFGNATGLVGDFRSGRKLGRDDVGDIDDPIAFGQEWQVHPDEPQIFRTLREPQFPESQCKLPSSFQVAERRRRLGESIIKIKQAESACSDKIHDPSDFDACVFDVLLTDDVDITVEYE
jgi:hypothetical protein